MKTKLTLSRTFKSWRLILISALLLPLFFILGFIIYMYILSQSTGLKGARGGPQDAFRHTYASAFVSRHLSPSLVKIATSLTERNPNSEHDQMDIHNNYLGIEIGLTDKPIYKTILNELKNPEIETKNPKKIHILNTSKWTSSDIF